MDKSDDDSKKNMGRTGSMDKVKEEQEPDAGKGASSGGGSEKSGDKEDKEDGDDKDDNDKNGYDDNMNGTCEPDHAVNGATQHDEQALNGNIHNGCSHTNGYGAEDGEEVVQSDEGWWWTVKSQALFTCEWHSVM